MDGLSWKTLFKMDDFGGTPIFGNIHSIFLDHPNWLDVKKSVLTKFFPVCAPNVSGFCYRAVLTKRPVFRLECALSTVGHMMSQGFLLLHNWSLYRSDQQKNVCPTDSSPAPNQDYRDISWQLSSSDRRVANILGRSMVDASSTCTPLTYPMKRGETCNKHCRNEPRKKPSHFPLYWLFNRDPYHGLI